MRLSCNWSRLLVAVSLALASLSPQEPWAQPQSSTQRACIVGYNKALGGVAKAQAKDIEACFKRHAAGTLADSLDECIVSDGYGRIAMARAKTLGAESSRCSAADPPDFGITNAETVNAAPVDEAMPLLHAVFGQRLACHPTEVQNHTVAGCQRAVLKKMARCQDALFGEFRKCKDRGIKSAVIQGAADLEACMGADANGKIAKQCDTLETTLSESPCAGADLGSAFPTVSGSCGTGDLAGCAGGVRRELRCRFCRAVNRADDLSRDCDLFDDGRVNGTCPTRCGDGTRDPEEECDDGNDSSGDGCSAACLLELPAACTRVCEADYLAAYGADPFFRETLDRATQLGYARTLASPIRCALPDQAGVMFVAALHHADGRTAVIRSRTDREGPMSTNVYRTLSESQLELMFAQGSLRFDASEDPQNPRVDVVDPHGNVVSGSASSVVAPPSDATTVFSTSVLPPGRCEQATRDFLQCVYQFVQGAGSCAACGLELLACWKQSNGRPGLSLLCLAAAELGLGFPCSSCVEALLGPCAPGNAINQACRTSTCKLGWCGWLGCRVFDIPFLRQGCIPACESCNLETGLCESRCPIEMCSFCAEEGCRFLSNADVVAATVIRDGRVRTWPDGTDSGCGFATNAELCGRLSACNSFGKYAVQYYPCSGAFFASLQFQGNAGYGMRDTCGMQCGPSGTLCNTTWVTERAYEDYRRKVAAAGLPILEGFPPLGAGVWFVPDEVKSCCPNVPVP